jgi:hypothetical protein
MALLVAKGVVPRIQVDTPFASTACNPVMAEVGISTLDRLCAEASQHPELVVRPFRAGIVEDPFMLSSEQASLSGVANALLRQAFGRENGRPSGSVHQGA